MNPLVLERLVIFEEAPHFAKKATILPSIPFSSRIRITPTVVLVLAPFRDLDDNRKGAFDECAVEVRVVPWMHRHRSDADFLLLR
jgi:hypothetical protein